MTKERDCQWYFETEGKVVSQGVNNPFVEYFSSAPYAALIRESIQNSIDAGIKDSTAPVEISYTLKSIKSSDYPNFLSSLRRHVNACYDSDDEEQTGDKFKPMLEYIDSKPENIFYLEVSDRNTKGMTYTPNEKKKGTFYSFLRSVGRTDKDGASGGSFGFGKGAYYNVSLLQTLIVSSRTPTGECLFEGASALCSHEIVEDGNLVAYTHTGFYDSAECGGDPIRENADSLYKIPDDFRRNECGTSINIMGFSQEGLSLTDITTRMAEAVLRHFFRAIYEEKLIVKLDLLPEDAAITISKETLSELLLKYFPKPNDTVQRNIIDKYNPRPYAGILGRATEIDLNADTTIEEVVDKCNDLTDVAFCKHLEKLGDVKLYVTKNEAAHGTILHMRKQNMLIFADRYDKKEGFYGIFVCDNEEGNGLLKMMEDPTHRKWDSARRRNSKTFSAPEAAAVLDEMVKFIKECISILFPTDNSSSEDVDYLKDQWFLPSVDGESKKTYEQGILTDLSDGKDGAGAPIGSTPGSPKNDSSKPEGSIYGNVEDYFIGDPNGEYTGGRGKKKKRKGEGDEYGPGGNTRHSKDSTGKHRKLKGGKIAIDYDVFAYREDDDVIYDLVIISETECASSTIKIYVSCDAERDDDIFIKWASVGKASESQIEMPLHIGENNVMFKLSENEKYAIIVSASEKKDSK